MRKNIFFFVGILVTFLFLILSIVPCVAIGFQNINTFDITTIKVAIYVGNGDERHYEKVLRYQWRVNDTTYRFETTRINRNDVLGCGDHPLTNQNFDVLMIGASARSYLINGQNEKWKRNIRDFVGNGGGYYGVCGGANAASQGFEKPENPFHKAVNSGALRIANVYINDDILGEWQYLLKFGFSGFFKNHNTNLTIGFVDVNTTVNKNVNNRIFSCYPSDYRHMAYAGGPGMYNANVNDSKYGPVIPLLIYNEELMFSKPIHYYIPTIHGWKIFRNVTTNLSGTFAGIATVYNNSGRVVLYGPHPEIYVVVNGSIVEEKGIGYLSPLLGRYYIYDYYGYDTNYTNYWVMRRSIAWAAKIPDEDLPPMDENSVSLIKPRKSRCVYYNDKQILRLFFGKKTVILGDINLTAYVPYPKDVEYVSFYVDDYLEDTVYKSYVNPSVYTTTLNKKLFGLHTVKVVAHSVQGSETWDEIEAWFFNL